MEAETANLNGKETNEHRTSNIELRMNEFYLFIKRLSVAIRSFDLRDSKVFRSRHQHESLSKPETRSGQDIQFFRFFTLTPDI